MDEKEIKLELTALQKEIEDLQDQIEEMKIVIEELINCLEDQEILSRRAYREARRARRK